MSIELLIQNNSTGDIFDVSNLIEGSINWETQRNGGAGKLEFNLIKDNQISFNEGSIVRFKYNNQNIFYGYVFSKKRDKQQIIKVTAYDQLRYLKNKDTYVFTGQKANQIFSKIAKDFNLKTGTVEDTGYIIPSMIEDNKTLLDIIYKALDLTLVTNKKMYVMFDNFGALNLRNIENLKTDLIIDGDSNLGDFDYTTSIDSDSANKVKLVHNNSQTNKRNVYIVEDSNNINKWGILQYYDVVDEGLNEAQIKDMANKTLSLYNRVFRTLNITVLGDIRARAGFSILINNVNIGDKILNQFLLIEKATHSFENNSHSMNLDLRII